MQDRIPRYAGRVMLTPVEGQLNTYDLVRADEPTQQGTPLNTQNILSNEASATIMTLAGVEPNNPSEAFIQLSKVLYPLKKNAVGILSGSYIGTGYSYAGENGGSITAPLLSLSMNFTPLVIVISKEDRDLENGCTIIPTNVNRAGSNANATNSSFYGISLTWGEYSLDITHTTYKNSQYDTSPNSKYNCGWNDSGKTYYYTVIGIVPDTGVIPEDQIDWQAAVLGLIDPTLTLSDHAADAKATGDALAEAAGDRAELRTELLRVADALDTSGLSWNNLPDEYYSGEVYTNNGITFTRNVDGSVHSVGTATDQARYYWLYKHNMTPGTYTLGGIPDGASSQSFALQYAITEGAPGSADYRLILKDTEITVPQGQLLTIRSWYKTGYVDEGHDWSVFLGKSIGVLDSRANPKNFVPVIYENQKAVQELRGYALPPYWETYLQEKAVDIRNAVYSVGNHGVVFQFFTDFHRPQSDVNYRGYTTLPQLLAYIKKHCFVEDVIFGGDVLQKNATAEEAAAVLEQYTQEFAELKPLNIVGNHDGNRYGGDPAGSALVDTGTLYSILFRGMEERVNLDPGMYWYRDNKTQKVRIIALNTGMETVGEWNADAAQHRWLVDTLASTPEGYTLIVIPHVFFQLSGGALALSGIGNSIKSIIDAYASRGVGTWQGVSYDFTYSGATVACIMCGHTHNDGVIMSDAGYPMIGTVCEAMWGSQQTVARGTQAKETIDEHAFDIVCLNTNTRTIKCIRVGSGSDRTYTYISDRTSPMPEETVEVTVPDSGNVFVTIDAGKIYHFVGDLISLELELGPLSGGSRQYHFDFISGDTPPTLTFTEGLIPTAVIMPDGFEIEANKRYEVDVMNGYGVVQEWTD